MNGVAIIVVLLAVNAGGYVVPGTNPDIDKAIRELLPPTSSNTKEVDLKRNVDTSKIQKNLTEMMELYNISPDVLAVVFTTELPPTETSDDSHSHSYYSTVVGANLQKKTNKTGLADLLSTTDYDSEKDDEDNPIETTTFQNDHRFLNGEVIITKYANSLTVADKENPCIVGTSGRKSITPRHLILEEGPQNASSKLESSLIVVIAFCLSIFPYL